MQGEAETILKGHLKKANHLRNMDDVRSENVWAPNVDTSQRPITSGRNFRIGRLDPTRAHSFRTPHGSPKIFRPGRVPDLTNPLFTLTMQRGMTHHWSSNGCNGGTTKPTTYLFRFGSLSKPASYTQASKAAGPRRSTHDWAKVNKANECQKRLQTHPNNPKVKTGKAKKRKKENVLSYGRKQRKLSS